MYNFINMITAQIYNPIILCDIGFTLMDGRWNVCPEVLEKLNTYKAQGTEIYMATDGFADEAADYDAHIAKHNDAVSLFDGIIHYDTFGCKKEDPDYWLQMLSYFGDNIKRIIVLDDQPNILSFAEDYGLSTVLASTYYPQDAMRHLDKVHNRVTARLMRHQNAY